MENWNENVVLVLQCRMSSTSRICFLDEDMNTEQGAICYCDVCSVTIYEAYGGGVKRRDKIHQ